MTELASHYVGNIATDTALEQHVHQALHHHRCLEVCLDESDRVKGRIYAQALSGEAIGITKDRSWSLSEGDVLQTEAGKLLLVHLKDQGLMVLRFTGNTQGYELALIHLGHALGNHHYPIGVRDQKIYIPVAGDRTSIESLIYSFKIPGLIMTYEQRSPAVLATDPAISISHHHHHDV